MTTTTTVGTGQMNPHPVVSVYIVTMGNIGIGLANVLTEGRIQDFGKENKG